MKNISFDNPYLLLLAIPIVLAIVIPYSISVSKDNKTLGWKISLGIHVVIGALITLALAGIMSVSVLTKTTVYVVADVSYSSERNLDEIDGYIAQIKDALPENSSLGIVCFGKNNVVLTSEGRKIRSVSEANVDDSATNIASALSYTGTLFKSDTLKRIVLITDGNDTVSHDSGAIASTVKRLTDSGIKIDVIFLNNALKDGETEVQISNVEYTESVYLGHENTAEFLVQSSADMNVIVRLYAQPYGSTEEEYEEIGSTTITAEAGFNVVSMPLPVDKSGIFSYKAVVEAENDISPNNNAVSFIQSVESKVKVLLITGESADRDFVEIMYGELAEVESYVVSGSKFNVPFTAEALTAYDEIVISNLDIRNINNANAFVDSLDIVVSQYGKSLITFGDLRIQNEKEDPIFAKFAELLPVEYGSANSAGRLYTIVLDVSHSMFMGTKFTTAKEAAIKLLSILEDEDYVCLVTFSGEIKATSPKKVKYCKSELIEQIESISTAHGTDIGLGLERALTEIKLMGLQENHVMLISDGNSFAHTVDALDVTAELVEKGAVVSGIAVYSSSDEDGRKNISAIAKVGGGNYYEMSGGSVNSPVFGDVADEITEAIVDLESAVNIAAYKDGIVDGFTAFPKVSRFIQSVGKYDATVPLTVSYSKSVTGKVPLYAYRSYGNGKVSTLTTSFSDEWTSLWSDDVKAAFFENILVENTPKAKVDYPYTLTVEYDEYEASVEIVPGVLDPAATTVVTITYPSGKTVKKELAFDSKKYFYTFEITEVGAYAIDVVYAYDDKEFTADSYFNISYLPEYNAYASFDSAKIYDFMRGNGSINTGKIPSLEHDKSEISTYKMSYRIPLLIASVVLFLIDIVVRKLKFADKRFAKAEKEKREKEKGEKA